jgi:predicted nucleotidyltransferase
MSSDQAAMVECLRRVLSEGSLVRLAILFGSHARERVHAGSDIDVGIVPRDPELGLSAELDLQTGLERACGAPVDLVRLDRASTLLRWEAAGNSIVLVEGSPREFSRFAAAAALEHADLMTTLGPAAERFRRRLVAGHDSSAAAVQGPPR